MMFESKHPTTVQDCQNEELKPPSMFLALNSTGNTFTVISVRFRSTVVLTSFIRVNVSAPKTLESLYDQNPTERAHK